MKIDVIFDTTCPWSFIGKIRLDKALADKKLAHNAQVRFWPYIMKLGHGFMIPPSQEWRMHPASERSQKIMQALDQAAAQHNLDFDFDKIPEPKASTLSHKFVRFAALYGQGDKAVDKLFYAYFIEHREISAVPVLQDIADSIALNFAEFEKQLEDDHYIGELESLTIRARRMGVTGVPCFIFNNSYAIAGAQSVQVFHRMLDLSCEAASGHDPQRTTPL